MPIINDEDGMIQHTTQRRDSAYYLFRKYIPSDCSEFIAIDFIFANRKGGGSRLLEKVIEENPSCDYILGVCVNKEEGIKFVEKKRISEIRLR